MKKTLSLVLAVIMMFSVFSLSINAADAEPTEVVVSSVKVSGKGIIVKWAPVAGAVSYVIYRTDSADSDNVVTVANVATTEYTDTKIKLTSINDNKATPVTYYYAVSAVLKNNTTTEYDFDGKNNSCEATCRCASMKTYTEPSTVYQQGYSYKKCSYCGYETKKVYKDQLAPKTPVIKKVSNTANGVYIKWNLVDGANTYFVYRKTGNGSWVLLNLVSGSTYTDKSAKSGTSYKYAVRAANIPESNAVLGSDIITGVTSVTLEWKLTRNCNAYYIVRVDSNNNIKYVGQVSTSKAVAKDDSGDKYLTFTDKTLKANEQYKYVAYAAMLSGFKASSAIEYLAMPDDFKITNNAKGITVSWETVKGAASYRVYRKAAGDEGYTLIGKGTAYKTKNAAGKEITRIKYLDTTVVAGEDYTYTVKAADGKNSSAYVKTSVVNKNAIRRLETPKLSKIENSKDGITIYWDKVEGAQGYYVYRKTSTGWVRLGTVNNARSTAYLVRDDQEKGVSNAKTNTYTVKAFYGKSTSSYNSTGIKILRIQQPELKTIKSVKSGVNIRWEDVAGAKGYYIYSKTGDKGWKRVGTVNGATKDSFTDKSAKKGTTYIYTVKAFNGKTVSSYDKTGLTVKDLY